LLTEGEFFLASFGRTCFNQIGREFIGKGGSGKGSYNSLFGTALCGKTGKTVGEGHVCVLGIDSILELWGILEKKHTTTGYRRKVKYIDNHKVPPAFTHLHPPTGEVGEKREKKAGNNTTYIGSTRLHITFPSHPLIGVRNIKRFPETLAI